LEQLLEEVVCQMNQFTRLEYIVIDTYLPFGFTAQ
jgi:hypothetical protein